MDEFVKPLADKLSDFHNLAQHIFRISDLTVSIRFTMNDTELNINLKALKKVRKKEFQEVCLSMISAQPAGGPVHRQHRGALQPGGAV